MPGKPPAQRSLRRTDIVDILLKKRISIKFQFSFFIILFTLFLTGSTLYFTLSEEREVLTHERIYMGQSLVRNLASGSKEALLLEDELYAVDIINDMMKNDYEKDIRYIFVTDQNGRVVAHSETRFMDSVFTDSLTRFTLRLNAPAMHRIRAKDEEVLDFSHPIFENVNKKKIGTARIGLSSASVKRVVERALKKVLSTSLFILLIGLIASIIWVRIVTKPISVLAKGAEIIGTGDLRHRFNVRSRNELGELAEILNKMTQDLEEAQKEIIAKHRLEHEIDLAKSIQARLLPDRIPEVKRADIAAFYRSAREVGGDYYDFINVDDEHLGLLVADVSGKSIPAAFMMGITRAMVRALAPNDPSPANVLACVNEVLKDNLNKGMFVTMLYVVLNLKTFNVKIASAGHDPLFYFRKKTGEYRLIRPRGLALGIGKDTFRKKIGEEEISLESGDLLALTTDGVNEASNAAEAFYGDNRLFEFLVKNAPQNVNFIMDGLVADIERFYRGDPQSDDITMVMLKVR